MLLFVPSDVILKERYTCVIYIRSVCVCVCAYKNVSKIWKLPKNSPRPKGDVKQNPYCVSTNITHQVTKLSRKMVTEICPTLVNTIFGINSIFFPTQHLSAFALAVEKE